MRIHIIDAGGTITSVPGPDGALVGAVDTATLQRIMPPGSPQFSIERVYGGLSEAMTFEDFAAISKAIRSACADREVSGVVVAHGTDTMEESAYYADLLHDCAKPVIFTGAQRAAHDLDFDGSRNLQDAAALAGYSEAAPHGVLICFGGLIIPASRACKSHLADTQGFCARDGNAGTVTGSSIVLPQPAVRAARFERGCLEERIALITLSAGMSGRMIDAAIAAGYRGIIIAGLGSGNAPKAVCCAIERAMAKGIVVALGTRCLSGVVDGIYASGHRLIRSGAIALGSLPPPQARILLSMSLEQPSPVAPAVIRDAIREAGMMATR